MPKFPELCLLYDSVRGAVLAGATDNPADVQLNTDEMAEISFIEIIPPRLANGVPEDLQYVWPVVDGSERDDVLLASGRHDSLMVPPSNGISAIGARKPEGYFVELGKPLWHPDVRQNALFNTTLKVKGRFRIRGQAGLAITQAWHMRAWGYLYNTENLPKFAPASLVVQNYFDARTSRTLPTAKTILVSQDTWDKLPGGNKQDKPIVHPFMRFSRNAAATTINRDYAFDADVAGQVADARENLWFKLNQLEALIVRALGVRSLVSNNLRLVSLYVNGFYHPEGALTIAGDPGFPARRLDNFAQFGSIQPMMPAVMDGLYTGIPLLDVPDLIWNENGGPIIRDNGAVVPALDTTVAIAGIRVSLG